MPIKIIIASIAKDFNGAKEVERGRNRKCNPSNDREIGTVEK